MANQTSQVKAWTFGSGGYPRSLALSQVEVPAVPAPGHFLIRIAAVALNPVDIQIINLPIWSIPFFGNPRVPGCDFSGTVIAAGEGTRLRVGDEVFGISPPLIGPGTLAEVIYIKEDGSSVVLERPPNWDQKHAAGLPLVWLTARTLIEHCRPDLSSSDAKLVVLGGSSAVGIQVLNLAKRNGWKTWTTCSPRNANFVTEIGGAEAIDYTSASARDTVRAVSPDVIIDCVGGTDFLGLASRFYVTIVGDKTNRVVLGGSAQYLTNPIMFLRWVWGVLGFGARYNCINLDIRSDYLEEGLSIGQDHVIIDSEFEYASADKAFERLSSGRARGKVLVKVSV